MSGLSEERRREIESWHAFADDASEHADAWVRFAWRAVRDLLAESAALRTEIDRLETLYDDAVGEISSARHVIDELTFEANRLAAPASPDDLARVADAARYLLSKYDAGWYGELLVASKTEPWQRMRNALARLTPPTGTAAGPEGQ